MEQISGVYNYWMVGFSFAIAILTSYTALDLTARVASNRGTARAAWLSGGAVAMGSGIWCMHYVGMLAFRLPLPVYYHVPTVGLSLLAAILASFTALYLVSRERMTPLNAAVGSVVMGSGIAAMHYIGMAAMRLPAMHEYHRGIWALSIVLAVAISLAGLLLLHYARMDNRGVWFKFSVAVVLGLAIPVMHYTGMAAVSFRTMAGSPNYANSIDISALTNFAIFAVTGLILGLALVTSTVDRRISRQQLLLENERKMLRSLIDHIPDCMYVKDAEGRFILANLQLARVLGVNDPQLLIGKTDKDFYPAELAAQFRADELTVMQTGEALLEYEEPGQNIAGDPVPVLTTKVPLRDRRGMVTGIVGVGRDIAERKRFEQALHEAERKFRIIFNEALVGIFKLDSEGGLIHVNPAMAELLGYASEEEMLSTVTGSLWAWAVLPERHAELMNILNDSGAVRNFELEVFRNDGGKIWISASLRTRYLDGQRAGFVGVVEDITEHRLLREQLLQAQKLEAVGQLAAGIAHEINTPMQYIGDNVRFVKESFIELRPWRDGCVGLLAAARRGEVTAEMLSEAVRAVENIDVDYLLAEVPQALEQTLEGVARVSGLVRAMKEFSHPGTGEKTPVDLNHCIQSTVMIARNEWKYVAEVKTELDPKLPQVSCLAGEVNQVILNIIINAVHAIEEVAGAGGPATGLITISTRTLAGSVEVRIQDTGGGIPEKVRMRIFDPFFTTKQVGRGTGQGLAIARSIIVDKHQGTLDFETEEGRGTTFIIRLPCQAAQAPVAELAMAVA